MSIIKSLYRSTCKIRYGCSTYRRVRSKLTERSFEISEKLQSAGNGRFRWKLERKSSFAADRRGKSSRICMNPATLWRIEEV